MNQICLDDNCSSLASFSCTCSKYLCETHSETHSSNYPQHSMSRLFRAVQEKSKHSIISQAILKKTAIEQMLQSVSTKVTQIQSSLDNFWFSFKVKTEERLNYLNSLIKNLESENLILINEPENLSEEQDYLYSYISPDMIDLEEYLDKYFKQVKITKFQVNALNQDLSIETKLKIVEQEGFFLEGISSHVIAMAVDRKQSIVALACLDKMVRICDAVGSSVKAVLKGHTNRVLCIVFSENNEFFASGSRDNSIIVWDSEKLAFRFSLSGHSSDVTGLAAVDLYLVSGSLDKTCIIWNFHTGAAIHTLKPFKGAVSSIQVTGNIKLVVSAHDNKFITFWEVFTGIKEEIKSGPVQKILLTHDDKILISSSNKSILFWDVASKKSTQVLKHPKKVFDFHINPLNPQTLFVVSKDKLIHIWDLQLMQKKSEIRTLDIQISSIISLKDKRSLIISYENSKIKSFDYEKKSFSSDFAGHTDGILCIAASPDCKLLFSGSRDETIRVWSTKSKKQLAVFEGHIDFITALAVTQDSQYLISGSLDSSIKIWELSSMSLFLNLVGHKTCIKSLTVTEDNKLLLSISDDLHSILWKIPEFSFRSSFNSSSDIEILREHPELHAVLLAKNMQSPKEL